MQKTEEKVNCEKKLRIKSRGNIFGVVIPLIPIAGLDECGVLKVYLSFITHSRIQ
jgi:hypothetical protein